MTRTSMKSTGSTRAGQRRRACPRASGVLVLAVVWAIGCGEALPLDGALARWLQAVSSEPPAAPAASSAPAEPAVPVISDAGSSSPDAGAAPACVADPFEPNDDSGLAAPIGARQALEATLCTDADIDYYRFAAPAPAGTQFSVRVRFEPALGDIDIVLTSAADGLVVAESSSVTAEEVVVAVSDGAEYVLEVALFEPGAPAGSPYTLELLVAADAENDCCTESGAPGCSDAPVRECVCAADPYCCVSGYDAYCVRLAESECGSQCPAPENSGSCCSVSSESGCIDATIEACVCDLAPFCCSGPYDSVCVSLASGACGAPCEEEAP